MAEILLTGSLPSRLLRDLDGREYMWCSGTDYLGMGHHAGFITHLTEGIGQYGTHFGSSRNNSLQLTIYREAEVLLAAFTGAPAALTVSSGMLAGQLIRGWLGKLSDTVVTYESPHLHPALRFPGSTKSSGTNWLGDAVEAINSAAADAMHVIYTDAIGSPWVEAVDFSPLMTLKRENTWVVVDDSHGLGVMGASGGGNYRQLAAIPGINLVVVASLNKALGIPGGVLLGRQNVLDGVRQSPWFSAGSPAPPAYMYALKQSIVHGDYYQAYVRLLQNNTLFRAAFDAGSRLAYLDDYVGYSTLDTGLYTFLKEQGILASCFSYPDPEAPPMVRLVISAAHQPADMERLAAACSAYYT